MNWRLAVQALLVLAPVSAAAADRDATALEWQAPIAVAPGAPLQRLQLPAAALVRLREPGYADLRVFDADRRPQAMALLDARPLVATSRFTPLTPMPILGAPGSLTITGIGLRVDLAGTSRVVRVEGSVGPPGSAMLLGVLLDTKPAMGRASVLTLDVDVPPQQPVTFRLDDSSDLREWRTLAESVVYRAPGRTARAVIPLTMIGSAERYLRVTWWAATPLLAPVSVTGATLTISNAAVPSSIVATLTDATLAGPRDLRATLPFATPVTAIRIVPADDGLIPVRILGRNDDERPWQLVGEGIAYRFTGAEGVKIGPSVPLSAGFRQIKIEADARTPGFPAVPKLELSFAPREIAVLLTGRAPYMLAAGQAGASPAFLSVSALLASVSDPDPMSLPAASVRADRPVVASASLGNDSRRRNWVLWTVLLGGTLSLGVLAWLAARKPAPN